jgi:hypothetical protein
MKSGEAVAWPAPAFSISVRIRAQLVGLRTERQRFSLSARSRQIARHQQNPAHRQTLARLLDPVAEIGVGVRLLVASGNGRKLLGQDQHGHRGRGRGQPAPKLLLQHPPRHLVGRGPEKARAKMAGTSMATSNLASSLPARQPNRHGA